MLFTFSHIVFALLAVSNMANAAIKDPTFTNIYDGTLLLDTTSLGVLPGGTFGGRVLFPFLGGNFTDASTGDLVATVVPGVGGELGVITGDSTIFTDVRLITQWVDDQTFGFWDVHGVGSVSRGAQSWTRLETNSASRVALTTSFLLTAIDVTVSPAKLAIYKLEFVARKV